jgi:hypothetical protein
MLAEMSFAIGGQETEAQLRRTHYQGTLGMRQSIPQEIVSVGKRRSEVAVIASKMTPLVSIAASLWLWLSQDPHPMLAKPCAIACE